MGTSPGLEPGTFSSIAITLLNRPSRVSVQEDDFLTFYQLNYEIHVKDG